MFSLPKTSVGLKPTLAAAAASLMLVLGSAVVSPGAVQAASASVALPDFTEVVERTEGSVVNIRTTEAVRVRTPGSRNDPYEMFRWFFGPDFMPGLPAPEGREAPSEKERTVPRGVGSGFIISDDGYILTNNHVVARSNGIFVTLTSGKEYQAKIIGSD